MTQTTGRFALRTVLVCVLALLAGGCNQPSGTQPAGSQRPAAATRAPVAAGSGACAPGAPASACPAATQDTVTRVVFIGKKEACDCTRKAIDAGLKSLETVLAAGHPLPVEKLEVDTDAEKVANYKTMKPFMALPAIYFLDVNEGIVELLQGEVSEAQVRTALQ